LSPGTGPAPLYGRSPKLAAFASFRRSTGPAHALRAPLAHYVKNIICLGGVSPARAPL